MNLNTLKKWTLLVPTVIVPALYLIGYFYHGGYLSAFGLDNSFFPLSLTEYLMQTFYMAVISIGFFFRKINENNHYFSYVAGFSAFTGLITACIDVYRTKINQILRPRLSMRYLKLVWMPIVMGVLGFFMVYLLLLAIAILVLLPAGAQHYGKNMAHEQIKNFNGCQNLQALPDTQRCVEITENREKRTGLLIARSATHIAIWTGTQVDLIETAGKRILISKGKASGDTAEKPSAPQ